MVALLEGADDNYILTFLPQIYRRNLALHMVDEAHTGQILNKFLDLQSANIHLDKEVKMKRKNLDDVAVKLGRVEQNSRKRFVLVFL